ncbi:zinc finger protein [Acrasis kona]|uniref:Zinc finger protein n=1 Tax=Acrasis kona TaxID=1008807 RepID=A0AAW2ZJP9_9EUKA
MESNEYTYGTRMKRPLPVDFDTIDAFDYSKQITENDIEEYTLCNELHLECEINNCLEVFGTKYDLNMHQKLHHKHFCNLCRKLYPKKNDLELHLTECHDSFFSTMVERGRDSYKCLVRECGAKFHQKSERDVHMKDVHHYQHEYEPYFYSFIRSEEDEDSYFQYQEFKS